MQIREIETPLITSAPSRPLSLDTLAFENLTLYYVVFISRMASVALDQGP